MVREPIGGGVTAETTHSYIDWAAILAGTAIAAGSSVVLTAFATGLGLGSISAEPDQGISGWALILTALFTAISMVAIYMLGGYIAGRMRRRIDRGDRDEVTARDGIHGLVVWSLGMLVGGMLAVNAVGSGARAVGSAAETAVQTAGSAVGGIAQGAGQVAGGAISGVGQLVGGAAQGAAQGASSLADMLPEGLQNNPVDYLTDGLLRRAQPEAGYSEAALRREATSILVQLVRTGEISDADVEYLKSAVAARTGLTEAEVEQRVNQAVAQARDVRQQAEQKLQQAQEALQQAQDQAAAAAEDAKQKAIQAAEDARQAGVLTAFLLAASALIAAVAAYIGAVRGGRHRDENKLWGGLRYHR